MGFEDRLGHTIIQVSTHLEHIEKIKPPDPKKMLSEIVARAKPLLSLAERVSLARKPTAYHAELANQPSALPDLLKKIQTADFSPDTPPSLSIFSDGETHQTVYEGHLEGADFIIRYAPGGGEKIHEEVRKLFLGFQVDENNQVIETRAYRIISPLDEGTSSLSPTSPVTPEELAEILDVLDHPVLVRAEKHPKPKSLNSERKQRHAQRMAETIELRDKIRRELEERQKKY
jgi:hypothetical protein